MPRKQNNKGKGPAKQRPRRRKPGGRGAAVRAPAAESASMTTSTPSIDRSSKHAIRVKHRELLTSVTNGSQSLFMSSFAINPGLPASFPWLSVMAADWEQYRFHKLEYQYLPRCSTSQTGSIIIAPDYDAYDAPPVSEQAMSTYFGAIEDSQWKSVNCRLDVDSLHPNGPRKYIRDKAVIGDLKTYDGGNLFFATTSTTDNNSVGKLWVEYDVELFVPQTAVSGGTPKPQYTTMLGLETAQTFASGVGAALQLSLTTSNGLGLTATGGEIFDFLPGVYTASLYFVMNDGTTEDFAVACNFNQDGNTLVFGQCAVSATDSAAQLLTSETLLVISDPTSIIQVFVQVDGAGGPFSISQSNCVLVISAA